MDRPTNMPTLIPILATTSIITRKIAVTMLPWSSVIIFSAQMVSSSVLTISMFSGRYGSNSDIFNMIARLASIALAPSLSFTSSVTASLPLTFEYDE